MKHNERFGALRALLQGTPSPKTWAEICVMVRGFDPTAFTDQVEPYAQAMLQTWPDHLRVTPRSWTKALVRGKGFPAIRLCRHLNLSRLIIHSEQITMLLRSQAHMQALKVLTLNGVHIDVDDLQMLYRLPALNQVQHLNAEFKCVRFNRTRMALGAPALTSAAQHALATSLPLKSLVVEHIEGIQEYLKSPQAQNLDYLKLCHWHGYQQDLELAFDGVELPQLRHFVMHLKNTYASYDAVEMTQQAELLAHIKATDSTWLALSAMDCGPYIEAQSWAHTDDFVFMSTAYNIANQKQARKVTHTLAQRNPSTRVHMMDTPRDFSWPAMSHALEALRAAHTRHTP